MSIPVIIDIAVPDPDIQPKTFAGSCAALKPLVTGRIDQTLATFIKGVDVPSVDDQDKVWFRINTIGSPVGTYFYHLGVWVREEPIVSARFGLYSGPVSGVFDGSGRGLKGAGPIAADLWGWALMNGQNGTVNLSNKFIIMGAMDNSGITGFDSNWRTNVNGVAEVSGGVAEITLDADNTYDPGLTVGVHDATGETLDNTGKLYGKVGDGSANLAVGTPNTTPDPISVVNPFYAFAMIQFVGYV
jgi:hypothetical protein